MSRSSRKLDHIQEALLQSPKNNGLQDVSFVHNSLPNVNMSQVSIESFIGELRLSSPIIMNAMTGGATETAIINEKLSIVARETNIPMAVGSQMAAVKDVNQRQSYAIVRQVNKNGVIFANLGGEATTSQAMEAIEMIEADALQIHLNPMQELIMPEGDRNFEGVIDRIAQIVNAVSVPVIVKEVGFGLSYESCKKLAQIGVRIVDVGGYGGTNFAQIENSRRVRPMPFLNEWGMNTCISLLEASKLHNNVHIIASGGIDNSLHIAKSIALGASAVGIAGPILKSVMQNSIDEAIQLIEGWKEELRLLMTALGCKSINDLQSVPIVIKDEAKQWCEAREINYLHFASRGQ